MWPLLLAATPALRLTTTASLPSVSSQRVKDFLATPSNWPTIVASSKAVAGVDGSDVSRPLEEGESVDETFGLLPILPLRVRWQRTAASDPNALAFRSPQGVPGLATDCAMDFTFADEGDSGCRLELVVSYEPASPVATGVAPLLAADNELALKVLLPRALGGGASGPVGSSDPIAGPLVALARRVGVLPEAEEDGWDGEPTAWAEADSLPQKLSELSQSGLGGFKQWVTEAQAGDYDKAAADSKIDAAIGKGGVLMFSFTSCPFCKSAKELLDAKGVTYEAIELNVEPDGAGVRARLGARTGRTSVPSVWIGGEYVGGLNDGPGLVPLDAAGELEPKLRAVGAM